jgi:DNA-binding LacI/PurR family transcriptional regulator
MSKQTLHAQRHERLADELRKEFQAAKPGDRVASMEAIAARFDVSINTARMALVLLQHEGWVDLRHGSGTFVSERSRVRHVGVLIELDVSQPRASQFYLRVGQELRALLMQNGVAARLYLGRTQPGRYSVEVTCPEFLEELTAGRMSAVAAVVAPWGSAWIEPIKRLQLPLVGLWSDVLPYRIDLDYRDMVRRGTDYLLAQGCRRLALMGWGSTTQSLVRDFRSAIEETGTQSREAWIRTDLHPSLPGAGWAEFREMWAASDEKPDGLLLLDDMLFDDVKTAILEMGIRVPDHFKLVTHANKGSGLTAPFPFARAEFDPDECAHHLGGMLLKLLKNEPVDPSVLIQGCRWCEPERKKKTRWAAGSLTTVGDATV